MHAEIKAETEVGFYYFIEMSRWLIKSNCSLLFLRLYLCMQVLAYAVYATALLVGRTKNLCRNWGKN